MHAVDLSVALCIPNLVWVSGRTLPMYVAVLAPFLFGLVSIKL